MAVWTKDNLATQIEALETTIANLIEFPAQQYTIESGGMRRTVTKIDLPDLIMLRDKLRREYQRKVTEEAIAADEGNPNKIRTRFV